MLQSNILKTKIEEDIIPEGFFRCRVCKIVKPLSDFYSEKRSLHRHRSECKKCNSAYHYNDKAREKNKLRNRIARLKDPRKVLYDGAKYRAKELGLPFNLAIDDVFVPTHCPVFGMPLQRGKGHIAENSPTLDRIIPSIGYIVGNVATISQHANRIKNNSSMWQIEAIIKYLISFKANPETYNPTLKISGDINRLTKFF